MTQKLLLIDDDRNNRLLVQISLQRFNNWQVTTCASAQALERAREDAFDAILLEIALCGEDGFKLFHQLQRNSTTQKIPVIFLTSRVMFEEMESYAQLNIMGVIAKPFDPATLGHIISEKMGWLHFACLPLLFSILVC